MRTNTVKNTLMALAIGLLCTISGFSQKQNLKNYRVRFDFTTMKQPNNSRVLEASFIAANKKNRRERIPVFDAAINFFNVDDDKDILLGTAKTNKEGIAQLTVPANTPYVTNEEGYINFKAVFEGTDGLDYEEAEVAVKDAFLELHLEEIDSVKTVILSAYTLDSIQTKIPLEETDIKFAVGGFLLNMPIQEGTVENGEFKFKFPANISGDKNGNITVIASIIDNDEFGNVVQKENVNWGISKKTEAETNKLWSKAAPLWMYIVLSILLFGVWANYAYSIVNLFKIRKEGKDLDLESESEY